jgi:hypothetical protein
MAMHRLSVITLTKIELIREMFTIEEVLHHTYIVILWIRLQKLNFSLRREKRWQRY